MDFKYEFAGTVKEIRRYPVKSILGESLSSVSIDHRGLFGDRLWAIKNSDGKFGSGKTTRRFQLMKGLFNYRARYVGADLIVTMPDGTDYRVEDHTFNEALSESLGIQAALTREDSISHFDEGPISIITTSAIHKLSQELDEPVDPRRFRANLLLDTEATGFPESDWINRPIKIGPTAILRVVAPLQRCVMVNNAQEEVKQDARVLKTLADHHGGIFGVWAKVECHGEINVGDEANLLEINR
ncbi:MOSC domain-containing protein [Tumebacillus avium]|uniref:MOSC domain-containing protein n=1 Tax=Tumebacillus avium TaxID=1903704 RepID=A0A1Y0ISV6_9BACL|nr:MOSC domain-containing protein [Tumebacillus avium]ARU62434.1 MOSC domain-containing protein [Tumebacillus avium]